jgi:hypothetical protein
MSQITVNHNKILLVKGTSGLGDRIKYLSTGLFYAHLTGRRLIVDWSDHYFSNDGTNVFHRFFQCSLSNPADEIPLTDYVSPSIWQGHLHESAPDMRRRYGRINDRQAWRKLSSDLRRVDYQEDVLVMCGHTLPINLLRSQVEGPFKEFAQASKEAIQRKLLREDLRLHPQIREKVDQFKDHNFRANTVGVHVRYTDYRIHVGSVLKRLDGLLEQEPDIRIFLATDNLQIKRLFEDLYRGVITRPHLYASTPGLPIHIGDNRPDPTESGIAALVDLYLLAECNYLIIDTSSSFSYLAALISKTTPANIFDVKRREKQHPRIRRLSHRLMLKLGMFSWRLNALRSYTKIRRATVGR